MKTLVWGESFKRVFKHVTHRQPELSQKVIHTLELLVEDPFQPLLHTHKLKGKLSGVWACTVDYDNRILFEFVKNPDLLQSDEEILLLTLGSHDEVY